MGLTCLIRVSHPLHPASSDNHLPCNSFCIGVDKKERNKILSYMEKKIIEKKRI